MKHRDFESKYIYFALFFLLISFSFWDISIYFRSVGELQDFPPVVEKEEEEVGKNAEAGGDFYALHNPLLQPLHLSTPRTFTTPTTTSTPFHALQYVCPVLLLPLDLSTSTQPIASCGAGHHCKSNILPLLVESITTSSFKQRIYQYNEAHIYLANNP